jgi:hypothetical protein
MPEGMFVTFLYGNCVGKRFLFPVGYFSHIAHGARKSLGIAGQHCENWSILTYLLPTASPAVTDGLVNGAT